MTKCTWHRAFVWNEAEKRLDVYEVFKGDWAGTGDDTKFSRTNDVTDTFYGDDPDEVADTLLHMGNELQRSCEKDAVFFSVADLDAHYKIED